jgi:THAP4-like, heme-binding beta-barrel domain
VLVSDNHAFAVLGATWRGTGRGEYPTIAGFVYTEELVIVPVPGRPLAHWRSTTREAATGEPRHAESGFLRATQEGVELVVAHGFGVLEAAIGSFDDTVLALRCTELMGTASAKRVDEVERRYELNGDTMRYQVSMAAVGLPLTHHLSAELHRA